MSWTRIGRLCNKTVTVVYTDNYTLSCTLHNGYCCVYNNNICFISTQKETLMIDGASWVVMNDYGTVDGTYYYYQAASYSGDVIKSYDIDFFVNDANMPSASSSDFETHVAYMVHNAILPVSYRYYLLVNGAEHYFEWQNATDGGVVFDMIRARASGGYQHTPMLAYDLNVIQSPSVQSMYYSYWGQQMSIVYRDTDYNVFGVHSNIVGDDTAFDYYVRLDYTAYGTDMLHAIRDYFDHKLNYRYYFDLRGVETYFEWVGATADGTVFDIRDTDGADPSHCGVLAYDLLKTPNPSITSMNQSGVDITRSMYIREHYNVYMAFVTTTPHDSQNPRGYDVQLAAEPGDSFSMAAAIRAYWDSKATKPLYIGVNGRAREVTDMYVGVNGRARKVTAIYVGVNGRAREVFKAT